jgi:hypothetical protein
LVQRWRGWLFAGQHLPDRHDLFFASGAKPVFLSGELSLVSNGKSGRAAKKENGPHPAPRSRALSHESAQTGNFGYLASITAGMREGGEGADRCHGCQIRGQEKPGLRRLRQPEQSCIFPNSVKSVDILLD